MRKISLAAVGICLFTLAGFSQTPNDSSKYGNRKLKLEEINFVSSYYHQDGDNSAVTGGIGTERLTDFATTIDVRLSKYDRKGRKRTVIGEVGLDVYTSASSDKIDPATVSSASSGDQRIYPSLGYSITNEKTGSTVSITGSISTEYDYFSKGLDIGWSKLSKDKNREFSVKGQVFLDTWTVILPIELRNSAAPHGSKPRNSYNASFTISQVITRRLQLLLLADVAYQEGQLATLYHRAYFTNGSHKFENLPDQRWKLPVGVRLNYFLGDEFILRTYYRYYADTWGLQSHTAELEAAMKVTPFFSVSPFYRYYTQQGIDYFKPYEGHALSETYYTSDYDLSALSSQMAGIGVRYAPPGGVFNIHTLNALEFRYGHYRRSTRLTSDIFTLLLKFK